MGCQCQCQKPKQENPLDEILSEKELDKNQLTNRLEPNEKINGNVFKNNKPQEIPNQSQFTIRGLKNIETYPKPEIEAPLEFLNGQPLNNNNNNINNSYGNNVKDSDIVLTTVKQVEKINEIKEEEEFKDLINNNNNNNNDNYNNNNNNNNDNYNNNNNGLNLIKEDIKKENIDDKKEENIEDKNSENNKNEKIEKKSIKSDEKKSEKKSMGSIKNLTEKSKEIKNDSIPNDLIPEDDFSKYIFEQINLIRTNPQSFIPIIEESKEKIVTDKNNRLIYKSKVKVALSRGEEAFEESISILKKTKPMNKLVFNPNIVIPLPSKIEEIKDRTYLKTKVREIISKNVKITNYWKDIIKDPETSFILMVVDDTGQKQGMKRKDILNPKIKYIGICSTMIDKNFVCYMTFSD